MNKKKTHKPFKLMFVIMKKKIISGATVLYSWLKYLKILKIFKNIKTKRIRNNQEEVRYLFYLKWIASTIQLVVYFNFQQVNEWSIGCDKKKLSSALKS